MGQEQDAKGVTEVKIVRRKWKVLGVAHGEFFRLRQAINLNAVLHVIESLLRQVETAGNGATAQPLNEISPGTVADFDDLFAEISGKLGERMDEGLVFVAK